MTNAAREAADAALQGISHALAEGAHPAYEDVADAVRRLVVLRDILIVETRQGGAPDRLDRANAILSQAHGAEYPLVGVHRRRLEQAADALRGLRGDL